MRTRIIFFTLIALVAIPTFGQYDNHLVLRKNGYRDKLNFLAGDPITFMRQGNSFAEEFVIDGISTKSIFVNGQEVPIKQIDCIIHRRKGFNFRASGKALLFAAPGYLVIGAINNLFQRISPVPTVNNLIVAGSLATTGLILPRFQVKKYRLGTRYSLIIVESDPELNKKR